MSLSNPLESIFEEIFASQSTAAEPTEDSGPVAAETIEEMRRRYLAMQAAEYRIDAANLAVLGETIKCSPGEIGEYGFDPQRCIESGGEWVSPETTLEHLRNTIEAAIAILDRLDSGEDEPDIAEITRSVARGS